MQFVTTDPARDDRATLRTYLDRFDPAFDGLTGPLPRDRQASATSVHVPIEKGEKLPSGGYEVTHGTQVARGAARRHGAGALDRGHRRRTLAEDLRTILTDGIPAGATRAAELALP